MDGGGYTRRNLCSGDRADKPSSPGSYFTPPSDLARDGARSRGGDVVIDRGDVVIDHGDVVIDPNQSDRLRGGAGLTGIRHEPWRDEHRLFPEANHLEGPSFKRRFGFDYSPRGLYPEENVRRKVNSDYYKFSSEQSFSGEQNFSVGARFSGEQSSNGKLSTLRTVSTDGRTAGTEQGRTERTGYHTFLAQGTTYRQSKIKI